MNKIIERYLKNTKNKYAYLLEEDKFPIAEYITTGNYALNALISGDPEKGIPSGRVIQFSGEASVGKSYISLDIVKQAQQLGYSIFYFDTEGANHYTQLIDRGVDPTSFVHIPCDVLKSVQADVLKLMDGVDSGEKVMIVIDSIGNLLSTKEYEDSRIDSGKRDMTKSQELKSLFRTMVLPSAAKNIPVIVVNHEYSTLELYSKKVQSGGTGPQYLSSITVSMSKSKEIEGAAKTVIGSGVRCTSVKNRFGKEKSQVRIVIDYAKGITKHSGLFDVASEVGAITSPKNGWYKIEGDEKLYRKKEFHNTSPIWKTLFDGGLADKIIAQYTYANSIEQKGTEEIDEFAGEENSVEES